jgi:hypothetical protein
MCLNEAYTETRTGENLSEAFPVLSEIRKCFFTIAFQLCLRICHQESPRDLEEMRLKDESIPTMLTYWTKTKIP